MHTFVSIKFHTGKRISIFKFSKKMMVVRKRCIILHKDQVSEVSHLLVQFIKVILQ